MEMPELNVPDCKQLEILNSFFRRLARRSRENDLSDVTWAFLCSSQELKAAFLQFFDVPRERALHAEVVREYPLRSGRVDFAFLEGGQPFLLIENKIWDCNYHIGQYDTAFQADQRPALFLLSNHFLDGSALEEADSFGWQVRLWSGLIAHLKGQEELCNSEGVYQYLLYLCEACRTMPVKEMRFDRRSLQSLCYFANLIEELVNSASNNQFQYGIYRTVRTNESGWYGFYYELRDKVSDKAAWPYFGIEFYDEEPVRIAIGFERDWNRVFQRLPEAFNNAACEDIEVIGPDHPEGSEHRFVCRMAPGTYSRFNSSNAEEQKNQVKQFFKSVNTVIERLLRETAPSGR